MAGKLRQTNIDQLEHLCYYEHRTAEIIWDISHVLG
jgi:hypothetical protein